MSEPSQDEARARKAGKSAAHALVIVIAVVFIAASAAQIIPVVFGLGLKPMVYAPPGTPERACAEGIRGLEQALNRASALAWSLRGSEGAGGDPAGVDLELQTFRRGLAPEWAAQADLERVCAKSRDGYDAWASLLRLRTAEEQLVLGGYVELAEVRGNLAAHLPAELR